MIFLHRASPSSLLHSPHGIGFDDETADVLRARLNDTMGLDRRVTAHQVAGEVSVVLHSGEMLTDSDPEAVAEWLYERGFRSGGCTPEPPNMLCSAYSGFWAKIANLHF